MKKSSVAVVIPWYHSELTKLEQLSFQSCLNVLGSYPLILIVPEGMKEEAYPQNPGLMFEKVPDFWLDSVESYNQMMLSRDFYARFKGYEYILLYQLDAFVFADRLMQFCLYGYDYIGAPWLKGQKYLRSLNRGVWYVGNGGFSLRRVAAFLEIFDRQPPEAVKIHEDVFWASCDSKQFKVAPPQVALKFAFEQDVRECFSRNRCQLPFGCHAWEKYDFDFWRPIFEERGYEADFSGQAGLDRASANQTDYHYLEADKKTLISGLRHLAGAGISDIYIFGAGRLGEECAWLLRHAGMESLVQICCVDNDSSTWGSYRWGIPVEPPRVLEKERKNKTVILIAVLHQAREVKRQLEEWGYQYRKDMFLYRDLTACIEDE